MQLENKNPAARAGASRANNPITSSRERNSANTSAEDLTFQAAYVSQRYRLSPCMARLICQLANIGGRIA